MRGVSTLAPLRGLVLALSQAAPSPALAGAARARQRLAEATASFAEALALREETRRAQAAAWAVRQEADEAARGALSSLRRAVAWMLGGERTEAYQRWREPAARLGGRSKRTEPGAERGGAEYPNTPGDRSANQCDRDPSASA
jgi:hypothetical protein